MSAEGLPQRIGQYKILSRLGSGGMGDVFLAEDTKLNRRVAIKRPRVDADAQAAARLLIEARAAARLEHPHICGIYEVGEDESGPFIVMPMVEGDTLASRLEAGPLPIEYAVAIAGQVADALSTAHAQGILHRDIKPANLIVNARGQARVLDFGLAKFTEPANTSQSAAETVGLLTTPGVTMGTVSYMSPEQARGETLDGRSDLFSLGVVLYEMTAGRRPFEGASAAEILAALQTRDAAPLARYRPEAPDALQRIVSKLLRRAPGERYQSAQDLVVDLRELARELGGLTSTPAARGTGATSGVSVARASRRGPMVAAVAVVALGAAAFLLMRRAPETAVAGGTTAIDSLAVLPFTSQASGADQEYVADGITESIIRNLAQLPKLKLISRNTMFRFKNRNADARTIAADLHVSSVMTGTMSHEDGRIAIDIELSSVADDTVILSRRYFQDAAHVARVESEISRDVARSLKVTLTGKDEQSLAREATSSAEAYQFYLRGRFFENQNTSDAMHKAVMEFQRAVEADPSYALAYAKMAESQVMLGIYFDAPGQAMTAARTSARQAVAIDPDLPDPHAILGLVSLLYDWDWPAAAREVGSTNRLAAESLNILGCTAHILETAGQLGDAEREIRRALEYDPLSVGLNTELGCGAYYRRKYDEAIRGMRDALLLEPRNDVAYWGLGRALGQKRQYKEALAELAKAGKPAGVELPIILSEMGYIHAVSGNKADALKIVREMTSPDYVGGFVDPYLVAIVYLGLGDVTNTFSWLEKAFEIRSPFMPSLPEDPKWDALKSDPRFKALTKRVGFV